MPRLWEARKDAIIGHGEVQVTLDPWISEWGNPAAWMAVMH